MKGKRYLLLALVAFVAKGILARFTARGSEDSTIVSIPTWTPTVKTVKLTAKSMTPTPEPTATTTENTREPAIAQVIVETANIRNGPSTDFKIVGQARKDLRFEVMGKVIGLDDWWEIKYKSYTRGMWVRDDLVSVSNADTVQISSNIPKLPTPTPTPKPILKITVKELHRYIERYVGRNVQYDGRIMQVIGTRSEYFLLVIVDDPDKFMGDLVALTYKGSRVRLLEDDNVSFIGEVEGLHTYETIRDTTNTVPYLTVIELDIVNQ